MRPVNLIPLEERRGDHAPTRTGSIPYMLLGVLAVALLAISAMVLTGKQVDDRKAEKATLQAREAEVSARAQELAPFAQFAQVSDAREQTVTSLAQSRFDWERVMRELALVLPDDIWLTGLSGSVSPDVQVEGATDAGLSTGVTGPTLSIGGCGTGHEAVAGFLEALKDIDGVTRVGIASSERSTTTGGSSSDSGSTSSCQTRAFISEFKITVAFDEAAVAATAPETAVPSPAQPGDTAQPELADARKQEQRARDSAAQQTERSHDAANIIPGVAK